MPRQQISRQNIFAPLEIPKAHDRKTKSLTGFTSIELPFYFKDSVLSAGSQLKSSFAILVGDTVFISRTFDDLRVPAIFEDFQKAILSKKRSLGLDFDIIACDLHPEYISTKYSKEVFLKAARRSKKIRLLEIQHHHAHIASCMADNGLSGKVIGVAFDGTGYGSDGNIWGGEFLIADFYNFERIAHFAYVPMPGSEKVILQPMRMAFSYLYKTYKKGVGRLKLDILKRIGEDKYVLFAGMIDKNINSPFTSSAGRLFDAVSSLMGIRDYISSEGEAAVELERIAAPDYSDIYKFEIAKNQKPMIIEFWQTIKAIVSDMKNKKPLAFISRRFHNTVAEVIREVCIAIRKRAGLDKVALSGGVFQNKILLSETNKRLVDAGFLVYTHSKTSCADRSLSLGQAVIAVHRAARAKSK